PSVGRPGPRGTSREGADDWAACPARAGVLSRGNPGLSPDPLPHGGGEESQRRGRNTVRRLAGMAERFYVNHQLAPGPVPLRGPEAHHLATVGRLRPGDLVCLFNGDGRQYPARVAEVSRKDVTVEVLATESPPREVGSRLEVAAPLPKGDRAQFLVE